MLKVLPTAADIPPAEISARFFRVEEAKPFGNEDLGYSLLLEKNWSLDTVKSTSADLGTTALKPLGLFRGPEVARANPYVLVQAIRLEKEITAADWLMHVSRTTGWDLVEASPAGPEFCDSLVETSVEGRAFWGRAAARLDGDRAFLLLAIGPESAFETMAPSYGAAVTSFRLLRPARRRSVEEHAIHRVGDAVSFSCPASWAANETRSAETHKVAVDLYNLIGDELHGFLRVKAARASSGVTLEREMDLVREELAHARISVGVRRAQSRPSLGNPRFRDALLRIHDATLQGNPTPMELWTCGIDAKSHVITVSLLVPGREKEFISWAIGRRAFEIALERLE